ncbi:MAG: hypothetical protein AAB930_02225, partial [Patescibacteria group bacterium]
GYFGSWWGAPKDLPSGSDYSLRVSDSNDSSVYGESGPFWVVSGTSAQWSTSGTYTSPYLTFRFATTSLPYTKEIRLYQKKPGDANLALAETFNIVYQCKTCQITSASGKWYLWYQQYGDYWSVWGQWLNVSAYPKGTYDYEIRTVSLDGIESPTPLARLRLHMLDTISILSPTVAESPINTTEPLIEWTIPADWPQAQDRRFVVQISHDWSTATPYLWSYIYTLASPYDTVGFRKYEPRVAPYDPTKWEIAPLSRGGTYLFNVWSNFSIFDPVLLSSTGYAALSTSTSKFWISP